jgi:hypothetical protein
MTIEWRPSEDVIAWARAELSITDAQIAAKADKLRMSYLGSSRVADWDVELRDWLAKDYPARQQQVAPQAPPLSLQRTWMRAQRDLGPIGWPDVAGPLPGHPGCRIDPSILAEFGYSSSRNGRAA